MFKLSLIIYFVITITMLQKESKADEGFRIPEKIQVAANKLLDSFRVFARNIKLLFKKPINKVAKKKDTIKRAFYKFMDECKKGKRRDNSLIDIEEEEYPILSASEMIVKHGYKVQTHTVRTTDGYHLILHRIILVPKRSDVTPKVVLLHHGLLGSTDDWILLGPNKSLPYLLSENGYDVWFANARGNKYSRTHSIRSLDSNGFWNFSWHEIGHFDLAATIDYIRRRTNASTQIDFIGHSMGATALLVLLSTSPQYNHVLRSAVFLAPLAFMYSVRGPLKFLAEFTHKEGADALSFLGEKEFMRKEVFPKKLVRKYCVGEDDLCSNPLLFLANGGQTIYNKKLKQEITGHVPAGGSTKTIVHYCQAAKSGQFQMFDFGVEENTRRYGMRSPPAYRLNDVTVPVAIVSSDDDWLSTSRDVLSLLPNLPYAMFHHVIKRMNFSHTDFVWAEDAPQLVYDVVLKTLEQIAPGRFRVNAL